MISLAQMGKIARKRQFTDICGSTLFPTRTRVTDALSKTSRACRILSEIYICICTCACCFWYVIGLKSFSLCVNVGSTPNASSSSGLSAGVSSSGPPSAASPALTSPNADQSFCFLSARCWFFSVCCWLFVVLKNKVDSHDEGYDSA